MVVCLERGADLHMAQLMPLPLTVSCFSKIQIGFTIRDAILIFNVRSKADISQLNLPFWYRLTRVVPEKGPLNGCVCVVVQLVPTVVQHS